MEMAEIQVTVEEMVMKADDIDHFAILSGMNTMRIVVLSLAVILTITTIPQLAIATMDERPYIFDAFVEEDPLQIGHTEHITVDIIDPNNQGNIVHIPDVDAQIILTAPSGHEKIYEVTTDEGGHTETAFTLDEDAEVGSYQLDVRPHADHDEIEYYEGGFEVVDSYQYNPDYTDDGEDISDSGNSDSGDSDNDGE